MTTQCGYDPRGFVFGICDAKSSTLALVDMDQSEAGQRDDAAQGLLLTGKATSELSVGPPHGFFRPTEKGNSDALSGASAIEKNSSSCGGLMRVPDSIACACPRW